MKLRTIYYFVITRDLSQGAGNEENGLTGSCGMECLVGGLWLLLYWLPLQITHPTLLILCYFHPCSSVWDISHNSENFFRLSPFLPGVIIASPMNVHIHVQCCKREETKGCGWGLRKLGEWPLLENLLQLKKNWP